MTARARPNLRQLALVLVLIVFLGAACDTDDDDEENGTTTEPSTSTTSPDRGTTSSTEPSATTVAGGTCEFAGDEAPKQAGAEGPLRFIDDVSHSIQEAGCIERVHFQFEEGEGDSAFGYDISYRDPPFADASGREIAVEGQAFLYVVLLNGTTTDITRDEPTAEQDPAVAPGAEFVRDVKLVSDFEGTSEWAIGLDARRRFTATADGRRLVIDVGPMP